MSNVDYDINKELGECYLFMGEYDKARDYYTKAIACDSAMAEPYMGLAAIAVRDHSRADGQMRFNRGRARSRLPAWRPRRPSSRWTASSRAASRPDRACVPWAGAPGYR